MNKIGITKTIDELLKLGYSKYRIAKECGVSWQTVQMWYKGVYEPTESRIVQILKVIEKAKQEDGKKDANI